MQKFLLLYKGPAKSPDALHEGWMQWFQKLGEHLVNRGSGIAHGYALHNDGSTSESTVSLNGYSIIQAEDQSEALRIVSDHPYLSLGQEHTVELFTLG